MTIAFEDTEASLIETGKDGYRRIKTKSAEYGTPL